MTQTLPADADGRDDFATSRQFGTSPVFTWGFPAPMKALIDRFYCLSGYHQDLDHAVLLEDKPIGLMMTCGGGETENHAILSRIHRNMMAFFGARELGFWLIPHATTPEAFGEDVRKRAVEFAAQLTVLDQQVGQSCDGRRRAPG